MLLSIVGNEAPFLFQMAGQDFRVVEFSLRERISTPFELELTLASEEEVDFDAVIGTEGLFTIRGEAAARHVHGMTNQFEQTGTIRLATTTRFYLYRAVIAPRLWLLSLEQDCRIFQQKSVPQIIKQVLEEGGVPPDRISFRLQGTYAPREYCVQYRETDLNFISRLLEEEGMFYYFEHGKNGHVMVFGDSMVNYSPIAGDPALVFNPPDGMATDEEYVYAFLLSRRLRTGKTTLRDFNFERPSLDLTCKDQDNCFIKPEVYDYPGEYADVERGGKLNKVRLQEAIMFRDTANGQSYCPRLTPGFTFALKKHELDNFNRDYLVVEAFHSGAQPQAVEEQSLGTSGLSYSNQFFCIPADVAFRSERATPRPVVEGVQTAIVVGPKGEEIYTDEHGRVKVQFHWDREGQRDEKSSCWIRVSQLWAGAGWGAMFIPRIGHEVIVDFEEGDPDRPIIVGRVYHATNTPPYSLPADKNKSAIKSDSTLGGGGSNELCFDDSKGSEEIFLHGQKDWSIAIENDKNQAVGHDESMMVANNRQKSVGVDQKETIGSNKTIRVGLNHKESIGANKTVNVGANHTESIGANMALTVGGNKTETVSVASAETVGAAKALSIGAGYQISVGAAMNESVGGLKAEEVGLYKSTNVGGSMTVTVGKNLTENVSKTHALKAKKVTIEAEDEITFKTGAASIKMKKNGDILLKGKNIKVKGSGKITLKGSKILEN